MKETEIEDAILWAELQAKYFPKKAKANLETPQSEEVRMSDWISTVLRYTGGNEQ